MALSRYKNRRPGFTHFPPIVPVDSFAGITPFKGEQKEYTSHFAPIPIAYFTTKGAP